MVDRSKLEVDMYKVVFEYEGGKMFKYYKKEQKVIDCIKEFPVGYKLMYVIDMTTGEEVEFNLD